MLYVQGIRATHVFQSLWQDADRPTAMQLRFWLGAFHAALQLPEVPGRKTFNAERSWFLMFRWYLRSTNRRTMTAIVTLFFAGQEFFFLLEVLEFCFRVKVQVERPWKWIRSWMNSLLQWHHNHLTEPEELVSWDGWKRSWKMNWVQMQRSWSMAPALQTLIRAMRTLMPRSMSQWHAAELNQSSDL